jgi:hypothetical protein
MARPAADLENKRFGAVLVIEFSRYSSDASRRRALWWCCCDCGNLFEAMGHRLLSGYITSCGCGIWRVNLRKTHGMTNMPEYYVWGSMKARCYNPNSEQYINYGARGIKVCNEWLDDFQAFYDHIGPRPSPKHSIDRHPNNNGDYEPGNVRWTTAIKQAANRRRKKTSKIYMLNGKEYTVTDLMRLRGCTLNSMKLRLKLFSVHHAVYGPNLYGGNYDPYKAYPRE